MVPEPGSRVLDLDRVNEKHSERVQPNPNPNRVKEKKETRGWQASLNRWSPPPLRGGKEPPAHGKKRTENPNPNLI